MSLTRTIIASAIMLLTLACLSYINHPVDVEPKKPFSTFPTQIGEWTGKEGRFDKKIYDILGVDDSFLCDYRRPNGEEVQLYVGYYKSQREGDLIHSPKNCMPGSGWNIVSSSIEAINMPSPSPKEMKVIRLNLQKGSQKQIVYYWFQSRGRVISSEYAQKVYLVIDSIFRRRTDGSFVRLIAPVVNGNEKDTLRSLRKFSEGLVPILNEYIPS